MFCLWCQIPNPAHIGDSLITAKIHKKGKDTLLAACDSDLLGQKIEFEDLEFYISERFYGGEEVSEDEFIDMLKRCTTANLVGEKTLRTTRKVYKLQKVIYIGDVPHAQIFKINTDR